MSAHSTMFLLADVAVVIAAARIGGRIAQAMKQPPVVGEIVAGIALGPSLLGLLPGDPSTWLFPTDVRPLLNAIAQVGLVLFMFIVGLELDMRLVRGRGRAAATISVCSVVLPFALGVGLGLLLYSSHGTVDGMPIDKLGMCLFLGIAMSITAFPVLARILTDRGMQRTAVGAFSLAAAAVDDIIAWSTLALIIAIIQGGSPTKVATTVGLTIVYTAIMFGVVRPLLAKLLTWRNRSSGFPADLLAVVLIGIFLSSAVTDWIGVHSIIGAFVFGVVMPKAGGEQLIREILERIEQAVVLLLLPMFFVITGLGVDLGGIHGTGWLQLLAVIAVACVGKFLGAYFGARTSNMPPRQSAAIAVLMNTRGLTELVILTAGRELGVLSDELFAMMVVMALVTTAMAGPLLSVIYPPKVIEKDIEALERRALTAGSATRVMMVIGDLSPDVDELAKRHAGLLATGAGADVIVAGVLPKESSADASSFAVPDFAAMAAAIEKLNTLATRLTDAASTSVLCRFTIDPVADLEAMADTSSPDLIVLDGSARETGLALTVAPVMLVDEARVRGLGGRLVCRAQDDRSGRTAVVIASEIAVRTRRDLLVETSSSRRRMLADLKPVAALGVRVDVAERGVGTESDDVLGVVDSDAAFGVFDGTEVSEEGLGDRISQKFGNDVPASAGRSVEG
ncbi:sodium:proton antiporter [Gordonia spumicola]|uniref:Sodium:proton antiporter n=1 Tax=Gordonia spumicola TaxID=589161 RepID=A0A7I9VDZ1_9ACTN|nr:cation:proton antiporter [Gordonia spumicola]GEE03432.1 sodium:proton antiporter [Gordonia spumicola]